LYWNYQYLGFIGDLYFKKIKALQTHGHIKKYKNCYNPY